MLKIPSLPFRYDGTNITFTFSAGVLCISSRIKLVHHRVFVLVVKSVSQVSVALGNYGSSCQRSGKILPGTLVISRHQDECNTLAAESGFRFTAAQ
jgi:hypothetical protein